MLIKAYHWLINTSEKIFFQWDGVSCIKDYLYEEKNDVTIRYFEQISVSDTSTSSLLKSISAVPKKLLFVNNYVTSVPMDQRYRSCANLQRLACSALIN